MTAEPSGAWTTDDLGAAAAALFAVLEAEEKSVTARYWRLGRLLDLARKPLTHGQWGAFLKHWQIDKTRSAKAMQIFRTFATPEETAGLTVAEAYGRRKKKPRARATQRRTSESAATETPVSQSWSQFADRMTVVVERQLEEPEFLTADEAATALTSLGRLLAALRLGEERLRRRCATAANS